MEDLTLRPKQQRRILILTQLLAGNLTTKEAAASLEVSVRTVETLRPRFRKLGAGALVHGNRGRSPVNRMKETTKQKVLSFALGKYMGFNFQHLTEMLVEVEGILVSSKTVARHLHAAGIATKRPKKARRHRKRRPRSTQEGLMLQMDGSVHDWLEGRGPKMTLVDAVDDATGRKWGLFFEGETSYAYMELFSEIVCEFGLPVSVYTDRTVIVAGASTRYKQRYETGNQPSQFGRALQELGVVSILANSAPAKGRVERTHDTDQDRLVSLLRLSGASNIDEANAVLRRYLRDYNRRFTVGALEPPAWKPLPTKLNLNDVLCLKEERVVAKDNTIRIYGEVIDIPPGPGAKSFAGCRVVVHRRYDLSVGVYLEGERIGGAAPSQARKLATTKQSTEKVAVS